MNENNTWKLLLIDDDEDDYLITRDLLSQANEYNVKLCWAASYEEGQKQIYHGGPFDAILIDYDLGARTGLDLVREVAQNTFPCPFILLTGRGSYAVDVEAMQAGVCLYLTKNEVNAMLLERSIRYAIQQKQNEKILQNRAARLQLLSDLAADLLRSREPVDLLDQVSRRLTELVEIDVYVHYQCSRDPNLLDLAAIGGYPQEVRAQLTHLKFGQAVCGTVAQTGQPMIVQHVQQSTDPRTHLIRRLGITAYACHPLLVHGRLFGTLSFGSRTRTHLDQESIELLRTVCDLMALAFERKETEQFRVSTETQKLFIHANDYPRRI